MARDYLRASVQIREALWKANPENVEIGAGLGRPLNNLGSLLRAAGRVADAEAAYRHSVQIHEVLWKANPENVEIKAHYAGSLCTVGRLDEAERLVDEVLSLVPQHPYARQLKAFINSQR